MKKTYYFLVFIAAFIAGCQSSAKWTFSKKISLQDIQPIGIIYENKNITIIGKEGHNEGELYYPTDVEIEEDLIYDLVGNLIQVLEEHLNKPIDLYIDNDTMYVVNYEGYSVSVFIKK